MVAETNTTGAAAEGRDLSDATRRIRAGMRVVTGRSFLIGFALVAILAVSLALRLNNINWDQGSSFHPDERAITDRVSQLDFGQLLEPSGLLSAEESRLNPRWFNYGSLHLYFLAGGKTVANILFDSDWNRHDIEQFGRRANAFVDTITVLVVFLLALRLFGSVSALLAALLYALSVIAIQNAHYATVDPLTTLCIALTVYFSVRYVGTGKNSDAALMGVFLGLSIASKFAASPVAAPVVAAHILRVWHPREQWHEVRVEMSQVVQLVRGLAISGGVGFVALFIGQPYMFLDIGQWTGDIMYQSRMVRRTYDLPYTRQYIDTAVFFYQMFQLSTFGLGIVLGVATWLALAWSGLRALFTFDRGLLVVLAFLVPYLFFVSSFDVKFLRYTLPATPILMALVGGSLGWLGHRALRSRSNLAFTGVVAVTIVIVLTTAHYAVAFLNVFAGPHPAHQVADWLGDNALPGSRVVVEHWDEGIRTRPTFETMHERLPLYDSENPDKWRTITRLLEEADYFAMFSNRLAATVPRLPERYPIGSRFYEMMFSGELGYAFRTAGERYPKFLGIAIRDDQYSRVPFGYPQAFARDSGEFLSIDWYGWADESHSVYEHPQSLLFENIGRLSAQEMYEFLEVDKHLAERAESGEREVGLQLDETARAAQQNGGTWDSIYWLSGLPNQFAWLVWLIAVQLITLAALPIAYVVFRPLADRGYFFAKLLGLLLVSTIAWLLASYSIIGFSAVSVAIAIGAVALVSGWLFRSKSREMLAFAKANWRYLLTVEVLFLVAFGGFVVFRLANPDLWHPVRGGEKPMDFAYLNAVTRSTIMPPYDPWYAGGYLNYYYYGQFMVASLIRLTGIVPGVAYNLAVPLIFAFTVGASYSIGFNLVAAAKRAIGSPRMGWAPVGFGLLTAVLVAIAANIDGLFQLIELSWKTLQDGLPFWRFDYWRSTRMMELHTGGNEITEFPFFTFLYSDLHAHMIAIPFSMLALGLAVTAALRVGMPRSLRWEGIATVCLLGVAVGALRQINSWDYPTQLLMAGGLVALAELFVGQSGFYLRLLSVALKSAGVFLVGYVVFLPFNTSYELFNSGIDLSQFHTPLWRYLMVHSLFVFAIFSWVFVEWRRGAFGLGEMAQRLGLTTQAGLVMPFALGVGLSAVFVAIVATLPEYLSALAATTGAGVLLLTAAAAYSVRHPMHRYIGIVAVLAATALVLTAAVDIVTVKNDIGRQNTIFKFYIQAWWLFGIAAAFAVWRLWDLGYLSLRRLSAARGLWMGVLAVLAVGVLVYPVMATRMKMSERFEQIGMGIDGEAFLDSATYHRDWPLELRHDRNGIQWLRENVEGSPTIIEAAWDLYTWSQRVSIYTGLPTVIGWDWHQTQQRWDYQFDIHARRAAVNDFYRSGDPREAVDILDRYGVRYVYVGELERNLYPEHGIKKLDEMEDLGLLAVYSRGPVAIYRYDKQPDETVQSGN